MTSWPSRPNPSRNVGDSKTVDDQSPEHACQAVLAAILPNPERPALRLIQDLYPRADTDFTITVLQLSRDIIEGTTDGVSKATGSESAPTLFDRLSFSWKLLRKADTSIRRLTKADFDNGSSLAVANKAFSTLLQIASGEGSSRKIDPFSPALAAPLLTELLRMLRLGEDARLLRRYWTFRKATSPTPLNGPFTNLLAPENSALLATLSWWCLRSMREAFVVVPKREPVRIEFKYVVDDILEAMKGWAEPEVGSSPLAALAIEDEINRWLTYSRLQIGFDATSAESPSQEVDKELARAFIKHNDLNTKLKVVRASVAGDPRFEALEAQLRQFADENRALEDKLRMLSTGGVSSAVPTAGDASGVRILSDLLALIDTKYSFDSLRDVQLGEDTHLTLRSFISHLFYGLRKVGLTEYPADGEFDLSYDSSGLFDCIDFDVPPGGQCRVRVLQRGWAIKTKGQLIPVRRAQVERTS